MGGRGKDVDSSCNCVYEYLSLRTTVNEHCNSVNENCKVIAVIASILRRLDILIYFHSMSIVIYSRLLYIWSLLVHNDHQRYVSSRSQPDR